MSGAYEIEAANLSRVSQERLAALALAGYDFTWCASVNPVWEWRAPPCAEGGLSYDCRHRWYSLHYAVEEAWFWANDHDARFNVFA